MRMHRHVKRTLVIAVGILFLITGIIGLVLPVVQGILFILIGTFLLSMYSATIRGWIDKHVKRHPHLKAAVDKIEDWIARAIGEP